jgi:hypothetical protein
LVNIEPEPSLLFASEVALDGKLVDAAKDVPECSWIILF